MSKFYGCGNPIPLGIKGLKLLDLGSGSGRDCYVAAKLVGETGSVIGIDMTDEQLDVSRKYIDSYTKTLGYSKPNLDFKKGYIEFLEKAGIEKNSLGMVISNCVVNLSPNKEQVLSSVFNVLKQGGEFHFSDVYCDRRLTEEVRNHRVLFGECISGALYINDFIRLCHKCGFTDPRVLSISEFSVNDEDLKAVVGPARFYSITYRLFKLGNLETKCEDYGQSVIYHGTIDKDAYQLDDHHRFENGRPYLICGNTAAMLSETWLKPHFTVSGDKTTHYGQYASVPLATSTTTGSGCC